MTEADDAQRERPEAWAPGDQILWRYLRNGRVLDCRPVTVVQDEPDQLAVWLAGGTRRVKPVLPDGSDIRTVPVDRRFRLGRIPAVQEWFGGGVLMLARPDEPWSVWLFWGADWRLNGWYVNLERPRERWSGGVDTEDLVLDVWVTPDRRWHFKDEDELAASREAGRFTDADVDAIYGHGHRAVDVVRAWGPPFNGGWENFRPDPAWPLPTLPDGWDAAPQIA
ncbi:DUF402 domain-containing protein [Yinghuangia seranimata]|uniref:DUF402 domain-containing protein n=1 Tax=Yinghuangia seranimata TaxID=408067 RepID=UPI00248C9B09|nr:DUF402 domain-containing protein [Yinghuangia seranimata]MDI2128860.1 DUF402 domain-containing protein [Yinghuangia seranimata]